MRYIICDSCGEHVEEPVREINYHTILDKNLCLDCEKKLDDKVRGKMKEDDYTISKYKEELREHLGAMCK